MASAVVTFLVYSGQWTVGFPRGKAADRATGLFSEELIKVRRVTKFQAPSTAALCFVFIVSQGHAESHFEHDAMRQLNTQACS